MTIRKFAEQHLTTIDAAERILSRKAERAESWAEVFCPDSGAYLGDFSDEDSAAFNRPGEWSEGEGIVEADLGGYRRWFRAADVVVA